MNPSTWLSSWAWTLRSLTKWCAALLCCLTVLVRQPVLQCLHTLPAQRTLDVVGAQPLTFVEWLQQLRRAAGKRPAPTLAIPFAAVMASAHFGRFVMPLLHPDNLRMLQRGNVADVAPLAAFLGRMPLSVEEGLCCI